MAVAALRYTDGRGLLHLHTAPLAGSARAVLAAGPILLFDPLHPERLLGVELPPGVEPDDLAGVLRLRADLAATFDPDVRSIAAVEAGELLPGVQRLAFANWYARMTPLDLERPLVMLDVAAARWRAPAASRSAAAELFDIHADDLLQLLRGEAADGSVSIGLVASLRTMVEAFAEALAGDTRIPEHRAAADRLHVVPVIARTPLVAGVHGGTGPPEAGITTTDWQSIPPRTLSTSEGNLTWTTAADGSTVSYDVTALAHPCLREEGDAAQRLLVRLANPADGSVAVVGPLALDGWDALGRRVFRAHMSVGPEQGGAGLVPDVVDARVAMRRRPRIGVDAARAHAERAAVRALTWSRLQAMADGGEPTWQELFRPADRYRASLVDLANGMDDGQAADWVAQVQRGTWRPTGPGAPLLSEWVALSRMVRDAAGCQRRGSRPDNGEGMWRGRRRVSDSGSRRCTVSRWMPGTPRRRPACKGCGSGSGSRGWWLRHRPAAGSSCAPERRTAGWSWTPR
jgi:hypothetical protein